MSMEDLIKKRNSLGYGSENPSRSATQKDLLDFRARIDKKITGRDDPLATVDVDYIDQYLNDHQQYWSGYGAGKDDAVNKNYRLDERRAAIDSWLSGSLADGTIDQEWYDQVSGLLSQADSSVGMYQGQRDAGAYMNDWRDWYHQSAGALDGMDWSTGRGGSAFIDEAMAGFADRDAATRAWLEENRTMLGEEYYKSMLAELDSYGGYADELRAAYDRSAEYFNQWDSQEIYDISQMSADELKAEMIRAQEAGKPVAFTTRDGQNVTWQMLYDSKFADEDLADRLAEYSQNDDWEEMSQGISKQSDTDSDYTIIYSLAQSSVPYDWETAEAYGYTREEFEAEDQRRRYIESKYGVDLHSGGAEANMTLRDLLLETDPGVSKEKDTFDDFRYLNEDELKVLNYIYNTQGREAALEWHEGREWLYENEAIKAITQEGQQYGAEHPLWGTLWHVGANIGGGVEQIVNMADYLKTGELHQNRTAARAAALTAGTSDRVDWNIGNFDAFDFVYQTAVSGVDSYANAQIFGPAAEVMLGLSAAASATNDAINRGASNSQAFWTGITAGTFEAIFEHASIENLRSMKAVASAKGKDIALNIAKSMLTNASEEALTEVANVVYDLIANGDFSQYETTIRQYQTMGLEPEEAKKKAAIDLGLQVLESGASGALMGLGFGVAGQAGPIIGNTIDAAYYSRLPKDVRNSVKRLQGFGMDKGAATDISIALYEGAEGYGDQAAAYMAAFDPNQDPYTYASDFRQAYEIGRNNGNREYLGKLSLNEDQRKIAYELGAAASRKAAQEATAPEKSESDEERTYSVSDEGTTIDSTGKAVKVMGFTSVGDKAVLELEDGKTIDAKEVSFGTEDEAVLYETVAQVSGSAETANRIMNSYSSVAGEISASDFAAGLRQAYDLGVSGQVAERQLGTYELAGKLPAAVRSAAFNRGKTVGDYKATARQAALEARGRQVKGQRQGQLHFDRKGRTFDSKRESSLKALEALSKALGINIYVYESYVEGGKRVYQDRTGAKKSAPNGFYDKDGIHIDLNAGNFGQGTMMFTVAHELTHFIKEWSPVKFRKLADILVSRYAEQGTSVRDLIDRQIAKAKENGREIDRDTAFEEVVADSMETMLSQGDIGQMMAELKQKDKTLWEKVREWFKNLADSLKAVADEYRDAKPESPEGRLVAQMDDFVKVLQQAYAEALVEAGENYRANDGVSQELQPGVEGVVTKADGTPVAYATKDNTVMLSMRTYEDSGRLALQKYLAKCVKNKSLTKQEMTDMLSDIEDIYMTCKEFKDKYAPFSKWSDAEVVTDTYGKPVFSVVTPNGEYKMNLDFSLVCKKRRTLDAVFNEMSRRGIIDDFELGQKSVVKINEIIRKYGLETACALCFVDAKRFRQASMADSFVNLYNELVYSLVPEDQRSHISRFNFAQYSTIKPAENAIDSWDSKKLDFRHLDHVMKTYGEKTVEYKAAKYIKNHPEGRKLLLRGDFMSSQGFDAVKTQNKDILSLYNSKKGTGGPKAAFGDVQYMNEIIKNSRGWSVKKAYEVGGVRIQSFSDYVPRMVFDYVQMIYDLSAKKLPAHAYSKEAIFVKQFGLTGVKINMSLIPAIAKDGIAPGLDKDGNYVWAGESFDFETAKQIQNAEGYTENCGTICVGVSYDHIVKLLGDPDIRMVIPYHKSGLNPIVAHMNKIAAFTDYTSLKTNPGGCQSTTDENGSKVEEEFDFNASLQRTKDPLKAVEEYKSWCAKNKYKPKFAEFAWHPNYYKLLIDFTVYDKDGNHVPQRGVKAVFPKDGDAFGSMKGLIKDGLEEDAVAEGKRDKNLGPIVDEIQRTLPKTEAEIEEVEVEQADRDLEADDVKLSDRDSSGNALTQEQQEYFRDSVVRDEQGRLLVMYHGTANGGAFTVFQGEKLGNSPRTSQIGQGFYFTNVKEEAQSYMVNMDAYGRASKGKNPHLHEVYLNITNPFNVNTDVLDMEAAKRVFVDGTEDYFFSNWVPFYLNKKSVNGRVYTKAELQAMSKEEKASVYVDYYAQFGQREVLQEMVRAFGSKNQGALLESMKNRLGYDGVVDEYAPGKYQYSAFSSAQIKSVDNRKPTENPDIRYSDRDAGAEKVAAALERQNAKLKRDVKDLRELLSLQGKLTHGSEFTKSSIEEAMRSLIKAAGARLNADDRLKMAGMLKDLYRYIAGDKELTWDGVEERAGAIADLLMNNVNIKAQRDAYADEILGYLRGTKIKLSDSQRAEVEKLYGYENYRKMLFGAKVYIGRNGIDLDSLWHEASRPDMFGGTFKDDVNEGDQPAALLDIIENMREGDDSAAMEYAYNWESIRQGLIQSIYDRYWQLETLETVADKKKAQMDKLREDHRKLMDEIREDQKYTLEKLRTIRENVLYTVRTDYEKGSYAPVKLIAESWKTDRKRALGEFRQIEDTFIQMAKDFERFGQQQVNQRAKDQKGFDKAREQFEKALKKEAERHDKDNELWTREFNRLLKEYDKSGRKIERLEERYKTREENLATGKQRAAVEKAAKSLMDMLSKPSKEAHVPMALQAPLEKFLNTIDFSSKRALRGGELTIRDVAYTRALQEVKTAIAKQRTALEGDADGTFSLDVPKDFLDRIEEHIGLINKATEGLDLTTNRVYEMTSDELKDLAFILKTINRAIRDIDRLHMAGAKARVSELAKSTVSEMGRRKAVKTEDGGAAMWANYTPTFAFERMGTAATQILNGLKMGQAKLARTAAAVIKFSNETYTNKEVKAWENEIHDVELDSGETVKMTTAQIMSFYCLSRREQAKGHLSGGGIRMGNIGEGRKTVRQTKHFRLTQNDIDKINGLLTDRPRAIAVANKMQRYMADVGGRLGNEISMARWDYMEMTDRDYFPIRSDSDIHDAKNPDQDKTNLWALLNKSFTKAPVEGANDAMIVSSIFDVFADHMSDMAEYNAFALPLVDAMKWYNYRESTKYESGHVKTVGVKKALTDKLGTAAAKYFIDLMTDINSSQKAGRYENFFGKLLSRSKAASVGWNLRVAIQQPTAILRASVYLDPISLVKGTVKKGMKASIEEMKKHSGIALWKSLGYYDLNISRGIRDQIKGDTTVLDQINDAGMWLPGKMDEVTWSRIWESCKAQVVKKQKLSGERLLEETAKLFEDVVYHTQVADSVLTRSSLMRSKSQTVKELTSFMAEPTLSVNLLLNAFQDYREGVSKSDKVKRTMKTLFCGYVLSAVANAIATAFMDAFRDDDEYEGYWDKFFQALLGEKFYDGNLFAELNPLEKIVFVRDVLSLLQGYEGAKNPFVELAESGIKLVQNIAKFFQGKGSLTVYGLIYQSLQVLGGFTGAAPANLLREASTIWNWTFGKWNNMPLHRYKTDPKSQIGDAYKSGALKKSEAREALMAAGISVTDAYYIIKGWDAGESVGRFDDVYKAALAGDDIGAAVAELVEHGEKTEKEVLSQLKSQIGTWYTDPESDTKIDRQEAEMMLRQYFDLDDEEIEEQLLLWDMKVDTGFSLDGLKQKFLDEAVSAEDAVRYLMEYGGKDQEDAQERVDDWAFEMEHGYSYDDIRQTYLDEEITADEAKSVMMEVAGKTEEEADYSLKLWDHEKEAKWRYEDRASLYKDGKITKEQLVDALIDVGEYDRRDAEYQVEVYEWEKAGLDGATIKRVQKWHEYCEKAGVTKEQFLRIQKFSSDTKNDVDANGKTINFSAMKKVMAEINKLPLSATQKDALAKSLGWSDKNIRKYKPW